MISQAVSAITNQGVTTTKNKNSGKEEFLGRSPFFRLEVFKHSLRISRTYTMMSSISSQKDMLNPLTAIYKFTITQVLNILHIKYNCSESPPVQAERKKVTKKM